MTVKESIEYLEGCEPDAEIIMMGASEWDRFINNQQEQEDFLEDHPSIVVLHATHN